MVPWSRDPVVPRSRSLDSARVGKNLPAKLESNPQHVGRGILGVWCAEDDPQSEGGAGLPWGAVVARSCSPVVPRPRQRSGR